MMILGLLGKAGSGKSTCAKYLSEQYDTYTFSFADGIKEMAGDFGFKTDQLYGTQEQKEALDPQWGLSARTFMQWLGQSARKHIGETVWIDCCLNRITNHARKWQEDYGFVPIYVIDDVRHLAEVGALLKEGAKIIKLVNPEAPPASNPNHRSEVEVDQVSETCLFETITSPPTENSEHLLSCLDIALEHLGHSTGHWGSFLNQGRTRSRYLRVHRASR